MSTYSGLEGKVFHSIFMPFSNFVIVKKKWYHEKKISLAGSGPCNKLQTHNFYVCGRAMGVGQLVLF